MTERTRRKVQVTKAGRSLVIEELVGAELKPGEYLQFYIRVPDNSTIITDKAKLADALCADALDCYSNGNWKHVVSIYDGHVHCVDVPKLKEWYTKQIAKMEAELARLLDAAR